MPVKRKAKSKRMIWADIVRIIAIYFVFLVHSTPNVFLGNSDILYKIVELSFFSIFKTCVPLFVILSGSLLLDKKEPLKIFYKKRFLKITLPWFFWSLLSALYFIAVVKLPINLITTFKEELLSLWFIPMIIGLYLVAPALRAFLQNSERINIYIIVGGWFISLSLLPFTHPTLAFPLHTDNGIVRQIVEYSGYFVLGYLLKNFKIRRNEFIILMFASILSVYWMVSNSISGIVSHSTDAGVYFDYLSPGIVTISTCIFLLVKFIVNNFEKNINRGFERSVVFLSSISFGIYLSQIISIDIMLRYTKWFPIRSGYMDPFIDGTIIFLICLILNIVVRTIKPLKVISS